MIDKKILLIGCGKMGFALLQSFLKGGVDAGNIFVIEPDADVKNKYRNVISRVNFFPDFNAMTKVYDYKHFFDFIILAVKPQNFDSTCKTYKIFDDHKTVFVSIAAGKSIESIQKCLSSKTPIIRAMPNLPAFIAQGLTAIMPNKFVSEAQLECARKIFSFSGDVIDVQQETDFDAITAVSGSGPAYVFHLVECLENAAIEQGISPEVASILARKTVQGSAQMAYESEESPATLRQNVTSKAGTTEAALNVLMKDDAMKKLFEKAIESATLRSKELNS